MPRDGDCCWCYWNEAAITVNGHTLTPAQAMTVRVALGSWLMDPDYIQDLGEIGTLYRARTDEVLALIHESVL